MSAARARKILIAAIAISLLLHLILAGFIRWPFQLQPRNESELITVKHVTIARVVPHTPPPTPVPTPVPTVRPRARVVPPPLTRSNKPGPVHAVSTGAPRPAHTAAPVATPAPSTPAPAATPPGLCAHPDASPAVASTPDPGDIPAQARSSKVSGTTAIQVSLDPSGRVTAAKIAQSSGDNGLDLVAAQMAQNATYSPGYASCKPVASVYTFTVKFVAW